MSDRWAVVLAMVTFAAALAAVDGHIGRVPLAAGLVVLAGAWALGRLRRFRPEVLVLAAGLLAVSLAQRSLDGLGAPLATGPVRAEVTLVGDPVPDSSGGASADVRLHAIERQWLGSAATGGCETARHVAGNARYTPMAARKLPP